jgi:hypothetical protein
MLVAPSEANRDRTVNARLPANGTQVTHSVRSQPERKVDKPEDARQKEREKVSKTSSRDDMMAGLLLVLFGLRQ